MPVGSDILTLNELEPGETARVVRVKPDSDISTRLLDLGLVPGTAVEFVRVAPFGSDPVLIRVRGSLFGLRRNEAALVEVGRK
jgi:Fe2+ transport system protein FeoA